MSGGVVVRREVYYVRGGQRVLVASGPFAEILSPKANTLCEVTMCWAGWRHPLSALVTIAARNDANHDLEHVAVVRVGARRAIDLRRRMRSPPRAWLVRR